MRLLAFSMHWGFSLQKILLFMTIVPNIRDICFLGLCKINEIMSSNWERYMEDLRWDNGRTGLNQLWEIYFAWNVCLVPHHRFNCKKEQEKVPGRHLRRVEELQGNRTEGYGKHVYSARIRRLLMLIR
jgi:hypothetical protein